MGQMYQKIDKIKLLILCKSKKSKALWQYESKASEFPVNSKTNTNLVSRYKILEIWLTTLLSNTDVVNLYTNSKRESKFPSIKSNIWINISWGIIKTTSRLFYWYCLMLCVAATGFNRLMIALLQWLINFLTGGLEEKIFMEIECSSTN